MNCDTIAKKSPHFMEGFDTEMALRIVSYSGKAADTLHSASNGHWMMTDPEEGT